jgi:hypothetical protein
MSEKKAKSVSDKSFGFFILGQAFIALSLGALYSKALVKSGLWFLIFILATLLASYYINVTILLWHKKEQKIKSKTLIFGFLGGFLLLFFFGIQSPQLPLKRYILIGGILLIIPALKNLIMDR